MFRSSCVLSIPYTAIVVEDSTEIPNCKNIIGAGAPHSIQTLYCRHCRNLVPIGAIVMKNRPILTDGIDIVIGVPPEIAQINRCMTLHYLKNGSIIRAFDDSTVHTHADHGGGRHAPERISALECP